MINGKYVREEEILSTMDAIKSILLPSSTNGRGSSLDEIQRKN